ncbi:MULTISPECIES: ribonuclease J [unclassified Paenibacillus]|uniref:ribonuclease J n=1 Tax=unclassified Paenibacillus TaxID=185978 RepID=UPI00240592F5|nr:MULTISPECIES: ribonuclease J [unclassified Paenibacillus]MDF9839304.1 ribonuclease J [Paenibacillus sp. PastF-2]MDF9845885.1 ribonuclease J [Paenibacillus sp. PastM-2]MDF9852458.1 ribonuclease J [Paenibacillus sp. PastF-1]MDH6477812.1 ribonuclease J [Paenibacillus sp. PastH-2]MDH6505551.1 ribonuclease J [Paenibacillus sp. PastM-3]
MPEDRLWIGALGGVTEIGKNMYFIQYGDDIIVVDCGSKFPDESLLGIDLIIPDISYLLAHPDKVKGLIVTHGHEDHIGGIPYLLKQLNLPLYASSLTLGLIESKLKEHGLLRQTSLHRIDSESILDFGSIKASFFRTNHSIPDCLGVVFDTPEGTVVHTGDFKFDMTPVNRQYPDIHKMADIGKKGVRFLLSESTNAERPGFTPSERLVGTHIEEAFQKADRRIFISTFASNVHRLQQIVDAASLTGRKLALLGRSMVNVVGVSQELGYLNVPEGMLVEPAEAAKLPPHEIAVLCTGSQGEPMAALSRLANSSNRQMEISAGDTVLLAANPIPGNERNVARIIDNLYVLGAKVIYGSRSELHVSGHGSQEELKLMLTLMKPEYFIPIHGEYRMLHHHRLLAEAVGVEEDKIFLLKNGELVESAGGVVRQSGRVPAGQIYVDGLGIGDIGNVVLRDRRQLSADGILITVITLSQSDGRLLNEPDTISRGFIYVRNSDKLIEEVNQLVIATLDKLNQSDLGQWNVIKQTLKEALGKFLYEKTKRRPMILPIIIEV